MHLNELDVLRLELENGDHATIALHGAQVLSWQTANHTTGALSEHLYLSPKAVFDGHSAIRGGIPICFPQFNQRVINQRPLSKHGFARNVAWRIQTTTKASTTLRLDESMLLPSQRSAWPYRFSALLEVALQPTQLSVQFSVSNTDQQAWPFALALHTYLRCQHIQQVTLKGLEQHHFWDAVAHFSEPGKLSAPSTALLRFNGETDRVYAQAPSTLTLSSEGLHGEPVASLSISQSESFTETVVWTPGQALCKQLSDMPEDDYRHMLCVEAAKINVPVLLSPQQTWRGKQTLTNTTLHKTKAPEGAF